jgi:hypothetical protein
MTKRWLVGLLIAGLFGGNAFADCIPSPNTPASVIEYFKNFNKPLPEQFCAKEDAHSEDPSQEPPQAYEDVPKASPLDERRGHYAHVPPDYLAIPEPLHPRHFEFRSRHFKFEWFY